MPTDPRTTPEVIPGWPVEPEYAGPSYTANSPAALLRDQREQLRYPPAMPTPAVVMMPMAMPAPTPFYGQPEPVPVQRDPWPARMAGAGMLLAGGGLGIYFAGLGIKAAGIGLWAVAAIVLGLAAMRRGGGGRQGAVNVSVRIDNRR